MIFSLCPCRLLRNGRRSPWGVLVAHRPGSRETERALALDKGAVRAKPPCASILAFRTEIPRTPPPGCRERYHNCRSRASPTPAPGTPARRVGKGEREAPGRAAGRRGRRGKRKEGRRRREAFAPGGRLVSGAAVAVVLTARDHLGRPARREHPAKTLRERQQFGYVEFAGGQLRDPPIDGGDIRWIEAPVAVSVQARHRIMLAFREI